MYGGKLGSSATPRSVTGMMLADHHLLVDYLRVGVPITLITLTINTALLALWP